MSFASRATPTAVVNHVDFHIDARNAFSHAIALDEPLQGSLSIQRSLLAFTSAPEFLIDILVNRERQGYRPSGNKSGLGFRHFP